MEARTYKRGSLQKGIAAAVMMVVIMFGGVGTVSAADGNGDQCILCHKSQYQNYDNGKSFCLEEDPMRCVDCHGGDPTATTKDAAHYDRSAHPVVDGDISTCNTCHLEDAASRAETFHEVAGLSDIIVESPVEKTGDAYVAFPDLETPHPAPLSAGSIGIALGLGLTAVIISNKRT